MATTVSAKGSGLSRPWERLSGLDRLASFRVVYVAILAFVLLYFFSVVGTEALLDRYFRGAVTEAIRVDGSEGPVATRIQQRVADVVRDSFWTRFAGVRVNAFVLAADGTPLYMGGRPVPPPPEAGSDWFAEAERLLPARAEVVVSLPHNALLSTAFLVLYGSLLVTGLFRYNRAVARREGELLRAAATQRDAAARRAQEIEREIEGVRERLLTVEPAEHAHGNEIRSLERERQELRAKLSNLAEREATLRATAERSTELDQERQALEELLEEAMEDLSQKEDTIQSLEGRLKKAAKAPPAGRVRGSEQLARRLRTLYKDLEFDDRAIQDLVALRDETMKLKAEESVKRLADDADHAAVRRKVGGLPPQLSIFELGFAGKGRIYYTKGRQRRYRILAVGAKNTQKTDLEYLSRLSPD